jgi:hypothetical protein
LSPADLRRRCVALIPLFLAAAVIVGCGPGESHLAVETLASVGQDEISDSWFERTYVDFLIRTGQNDTDSNRRAHLENLVDAVLLAGEAERRGLMTDSTFQQFRVRERKKALGTVFFHEALLETLPPPTEQEVRLAFARWKAQVVVRHIYFRSRGEAEESYNRIRAGKDFLIEAQDVFGVPGDSSAGYLGPIKYFEMDDAFAEAAFNLQEGAFSSPVQSRFGWHLIRSERVMVSPLLTEDEFQTKQEGIASQFRLRRRKVEGDAFVREFMEEHDVKAEPAAIAAIASMIDDLTIEAAPQPEIGGDDEATQRMVIDSLRAIMNSETVLATYTLGGRQRAMTAGEYVGWLEDLPFAEARNNTVTSVGRALRNEVFAEEAERRGLEDEAARMLVWEASTLRLAGMLRNQLRQRPGQVADSLIVLAAERAGWFSRSVRPADPDSDMAMMRRTLAPVVAEFQLIESLRKQTPVTIDTLLFLRMAEGLDVVPKRR